MIRITYDRAADAAYVHLQPIAPGQAVRQEELEADGVILDFDEQGHLLGIEVLGASGKLATEVLEGAELQDAAGPTRHAS